MNEEMESNKCTHRYFIQCATVFGKGGRLSVQKCIDCQMLVINVFGDALNLDDINYIKGDEK